MPFPPSGRAGPSSTTRSTWRCTSARSRTPISSGARPASASTGSSPTPGSRTPPTTPDNVSIKWYEDGTLNVCANCIDRHLKNRADQVAIIWEGDDPTLDEKITYRQLHERVCKFANVLKANGVKKGDRVTVYLPMIPEAAYAILACARIGAVHSVVFGGFSPDSLAGRIVDADSKFIVTADEGVRGGRPIPLKKNTDDGAEEVQGRREGAGRAPHRRDRSRGRPAGTSGCTRSWSRSTPTARRWR